MKIDRLRITVCSLLVVAILFVVGTIVYDSVESSYLPAWHSAGNYAPSGLMSQFEKDNITNPEAYDTSQMMIQKVSFPNQDKPLYFIDTQTSEEDDRELLCGAAGCLFAGYMKTGWRAFNPVFDFYLNPHVPPEHELLSADMTMRNGMPVIYVIQRSSPTKATLVRATLVFNGSQYVVTRVD